MARPVNHTLEEVLTAAERGITKTGASKVLGVSLQTITNYCKRWKSVDEAFKVKRKELVDLSEMALRGAVIRQEPWAVAFTLKTLGKNEGYTERNEIVVEGLLKHIDVKRLNNEQLERIANGDDPIKVLLNS